MGRSPGWLSRYRDGRRDEVWQELDLLGDGVRADGFAEEAQLVCDEMAHRARHNVELIVERLTNAGYRFHDNDDEQTPARPHTPPTADAPALIEWMEERFGPVPMTLSSWVRIVGDVWLVGTHPEWESSASADPLVIEAEGSRYETEASIRDYFEDEWEQRGGSEFVLPLAPDRLHKDNISGGGPYGIMLPDARVDGLFEREWENGKVPFIAYLNLVFAEGGFPHPTDEQAQGEVRKHLAAGLLPL